MNYTFITGASSGLGRSTAQVLSKQFPLILHGRNVQELEATKQSCHNPEQHLVWPFDFRDISELGVNLGKFLVINQAGVNHFIHCAGMVRIQPTRLVNLNDANELMNVNFFSALECTKVLIKKGNKKNLENIVYISSMYSEVGAKGQGIYCASKAALDGLMRSLAVELAPQIRVNSILPGAIKTKMSEETFKNENYIKSINERYLLGFGGTEDIANMIEFLISPKAKWITGQQIRVDGGATVH